MLEIAYNNQAITPSRIATTLKPEVRTSFDQFCNNIADTHEGLCDKLRLDVLQYYTTIHKIDIKDKEKEMMDASNFTNDLYKKDMLGGKVYADLSVKYHLTAMRLGCLGSRQLFPRCLNLIKTVDVCMQQFCDQEF